MLILFYLTAALILASGLAVVLLKNPLHGALCLILTMIGVALTFVFLQAHFLAVVQLIVYAGAIIVLVLFVLMLLNFKGEDLGSLPLPVWLLSFFAGALFLYFMIPFLISSFETLNEQAGELALKNALPEGTVRVIGELLFTRYVFTFEAASILIMAALVGAVMVGSRSIHKNNNAETGR